MEFKDLLDLVEKSDTDELKKHFLQEKSLVDSYDENGMTLLQHACYQGNLQMVKFLITEGASINHYKQNEGYTALMFASLMGHIPIIKLLLEFGARHQDTNKVNRTAAEMAGFVGKHVAVSVLNNYVEKSTLKKYSLPDGPSSRIRLQSEFVNELAAIVNDFNFMPVKIFKKLSASYRKKDKSILMSATQIANDVLEDLINQNFTSHNMNETVALKLHFIATIFRFSQENINLEEKKESSFYPLYGITRKFLLNSRTKEEKFMFDALKSYKYTDSTLWQGIVKHVASSCNEENKASPKRIILKHINCTSPSFAEDIAHICSTCEAYEGTDETTIKMKSCSACHKIFYCSKDCQVMHWFIHKKNCTQSAQEDEN